MRTVCWQTILMKYHTVFLSKIVNDQCRENGRLLQSYLALKDDKNLKGVDKANAKLERKHYTRMEC